MSEGLDNIDERPATPPTHTEPIVYRPRGNTPSTLPPVPGDATPTSPGALLFGPVTKNNTTPSPRPKPLPLTTQDVTSWWGSSDPVRQWKEKGTPAAKRSLEPEQEDRWNHTKGRVSLALQSTIGYTLDVTHDALEIGANLLRFAPIAGLDEAAHVLLSIWDALQHVDTNKLACLRLTERCAEILLAVRAEVHDAGDKVGEELAAPLDRLTNSFRSVHILLQKQVHRPFIKRYLKRDEITRSINGCDAELKDALEMFSLSIQVRTLKQIVIIEKQRKADNEKILAALVANGIDLEKTPRPTLISLPETDATLTKGQSQTASSTGGSQTSDSVTIPSGPPPTPANNKAIPTIQLSPDAIRVQLETIVAAQNEADRAMDLEDLRRVLREVLATASDAEIIRLLQVQREDMPEAVKTLQRAFEQCLEHENEHQSNEEKEVVEQRSSQPSSGTVTAKRSSTLATVSVDSSQGGPLSNLRRRFTLDNQKSKSGKLGKGANKRVQHFEALDKEFIESGIDALRRLSTGQDLTLPSWTITRYEVDLEEKIGVGFFSDVYKAAWRRRTVAVKVLAGSTPRKLFLKEMQVWKKLDHPNVLPLFGASSARGDPPWFFVSPYMKYGNVVTYLRRSHKAADSFTHKRMIHEIATGMEYLHSRDITHGDLKGTNVLIDDGRHCVISDFGQSDMKSEAYRISGSAPAMGALRWRAPEILDGLGPGRPSAAADVYAFAIVCVEILGQGALPWSMLEDEDVRGLVLQNKRPVIPCSPNTDIGRIVTKCWVQDPQLRPTFTTIIEELQKSGVSKFVESPSVSMTRAEAWDINKHRQSPDIRPNTPLPIIEPLPMISDKPEQGSSLASANPSEMTTTTGTTGSYHTAPTTIIPVQRVITPIREDDKQASPVEYKPIRMPVPEPYSPIQQQSDFPPSDSLLFSSAPLQESQAVPAEGLVPATWDDQHVRSVTFPIAPASVQPATSLAQRSNTAATTYSKGSTTTTESKDSDEVIRAGPRVNRDFQSPVPADEQIRQMKNEKRYRLNLQHDFNASLKLALWDPCLVELGAVGYLDKRQGRFITLLNAFDPVMSSEGRAKGMPTLYGYGKVSKGEQRQGRNVAQRGLDLIQGLLPFVNRNGQFSQSVSRRYSFPIHAGKKSAYLCAESTRYKYIVDQRLESPKEWFKSNIKTILKIYGRGHCLQKEDVYLIIGTLCAQEYALFVNHNRPDGQVHFNVFASPKVGQDWGVFSTDLTLPSSTSGGPYYDDFHAEESDKYWTANKVSQVNPNRPWDAVLLARLRFKPDNDVPTSL